jgi:hypothetical protein
VKKEDKKKDMTEYLMDEDKQDKPKEMARYAVDRIIKKRIKDQREKDRYYSTKEGQEELRKKDEEQKQILDLKLARIMKERDTESSRMRANLQKRLRDRERKLRKNK